MSDHEIEILWTKQQALKYGTQVHEESEIVLNTVDFERILETLDAIQLLSETENCFDGSKSDISNLQLFVELLSKSSSFAHKAHKELNKLIKK